MTYENKKKRQIFLPRYKPEWITGEYIIQCFQDKELQESWKPELGDWYVCKDTDVVRQMDGLDNFDAPTPESIGKDDIFIPNPSQLEERVKKLRAEQRHSSSVSE